MDVALQQQVNEGTALPLMEAFYTLQGEGYYKGSAAYFIRIGGCDVGCHWCDVKESWDAAKHPPTQIQEIVEEAYQYSKTIVITGGEPLMWNMEPLTQALNLKNMQIHIETSGAYPITGNWDWFCLSPKRICFLQLRLTILPMNLKSLFIIKMIYFLQKNKPNM